MPLCKVPVDFFVCVPVDSAMPLVIYLNKFKQLLILIGKRCIFA